MNGFIGRKKVELDATILRDLGLEDLAHIRHERGIKPQPITKKLSERHHTLARLLADGQCTEWEAAVATGYTPARVSVLKGDPTFRELIEFYSIHKDVQYIDGHRATAGLYLDTVEELRTRVEETPHEFTVDQLISTAKFSGDRAGFGPTTTNVNVNVDMAERLARSKERARQIMIDARAERTLTDVEPVTPPDPLHIERDG